MQLLDGKVYSRQILDELKGEVAALGDPPPRVVFVRLGEDPASVSYVNAKNRAAAELGIQGEVRVLPDTTSQSELLAVLDQLNGDPAVHGILVQSPLPAHIDEQRVFNHVSPDKDVDGFSALNLGRLVQEDPHAFVACTPAGIVEMLARGGISTVGQHVVVIGRSLIVGKPAALLMLRKGAGGDATVTVCHSRTRDLPRLTRQADILVAAIGRPRFVSGEMVKDGAVVMDVGINRIEDPSAPRGYRLVGDVDFEAVAPRCRAITPVPGGVGLMTVALLMRNTVQAHRHA